LALEPGLAPLANIRPVLLGGMRCLFLRVIWWRRQKRQSALTLTWAPFSAKRAFNSGRVMSGTAASAAWIRSAWASMGLDGPRWASMGLGSPREPVPALRLGPGIPASPAHPLPADRAGGAHAKPGRGLAAR
jgi:hypothetical protein